MLYKLNLMPYNYTVKELDKDRKEKEIIKVYDVREAIVNVMLNPRQQMKGFRQFTVGKVASRVKSCKEGYILLDSVEHRIAEESFSRMMGFGPHDMELLNRIYKMEEIIDPDKNIPH